MHATTIVAYIYAADIYCPSCIRTFAAYALAEPGEAAFMGRPSDGDGVEEFVARWAALVGVDHLEEETYDSGDFPKVVFADQLLPVEHCGGCLEELL